MTLPVDEPDKTWVDAVRRSVSLNFVTKEDAVINKHEEIDKHIILLTSAKG